MFRINTTQSTVRFPTFHQDFQKMECVAGSRVEIVRGDRSLIEHRHIVLREKKKLQFIN